MSADNARKSDGVIQNYDRCLLHDHVWDDVQGNNTMAEVREGNTGMRTPGTTRPRAEKLMFDCIRP